MRTLLPKKEKYYKEYADSVSKKARQLRYGIQSCVLSVADELMVSIRKELVDWQSNEDEDALSQTNLNYTTFLPVNYQNDTLVQYDTTHNAWGPGYYQTSSKGPQSMGVGFSYGNGSQNIIEVNSGGCITRINLNPAITINNQAVAQFAHRQSVASDTWTINHNLGFNPNVLTLNELNEEIEGVITSTSGVTTVIQFSEPVSGYAYLS